MYPRFGLVLMVSHACNMRCTYCYTGRKFARSMPEKLGRKAIDRAIASLEPGGTLELGFFGGEPLLKAELVCSLLGYARYRARAAGVELCPGLTTNGTVTGPTAWSLMMLPELSLAVSCDGLPQVHDHHRRFADGRGSSDAVLRTMRRLLAEGKDFSAVVVARPDTVELLPEGVAFLHALGVSFVEPSLDLWAEWGTADVRHLELAIERTADIWRDALPDLGVGWFDEKAAGLARVPMTKTARCSFGDGEIAVAPSGSLYPCERLIGEDAESNPMRLPGHVLEGGDFACEAAPAGRCAAACGQCRIQSICNTTCRCSNYVRTGHCGKPDSLLCALNRFCARETARVLGELSVRPARKPSRRCVTVPE
jgi:uncharacterized protein